MARTTVQRKKVIAAYEDSLKSHLRLDDVLVFGSLARGTAAASSDVDVIVLSRDFKRMPFLERLQFLNRMRTGSALSVPMDIIGFTPKEFTSLAKSESPNLRRIYREARRI